MLDGAFNIRESESMKKNPVGDFFFISSLLCPKRIKIHIGEIAHPLGDGRLL